MKNRKEIIEERLLRDNIRKIIKKNLVNMKKQDSLQEQNLRNSIRNIILEKVAVPDKVCKKFKAILSPVRRELKFP